MCLQSWSASYLRQWRRTATDATNPATCVTPGACTANENRLSFASDLYYDRFYDCVNLDDPDYDGCVRVLSYATYDEIIEHKVTGAVL